MSESPQRSKWEGKVKVLTDEELIKLPPVKTRFLIENVLSTGLCILCATPKFGKSVLALNWATEIAQGGMAFGSIPVHKARVLYLPFEDRADDLQYRLKLALNSRKANGNILFGVQWPRFEEGGVDLIEATLAKYPDIQLVVIDTWVNFRAAQTNKGSLYEQDYKPLSTLQDLCKRHPHLTILGIHHVNKSDNEDVFKKISGTTGITAACDTILVAERDNDSIEGTLHIIGRKVRYTKLSITYNESRLYWELVGGSTDPNAAIRQSILAILAEGGSQRLTTVGVVKQLKQIGASIGVTRAQRILADMVVAGQLASGKGENPRFWLATAPAPEVQEEIPLSPPVNQVSPPGWISRQDIEIQEGQLVVVDQDFNYPAIVEDAPERFFRAIDDERRGVVYENLVAIWYYRQAGDWEQALELASTFANDLEAAEWFTKEEAIISISKALQAMDRRAKTIHK